MNSDKWRTCRARYPLGGVGVSRGRAAKPTVVRTTPTTRNTKDSAKRQRFAESRVAQRRGTACSEDKPRRPWLSTVDIDEGSVWMTIAVVG